MREIEQMGALGGVKSQRACDPLEKMRRDLDLAALLEPRIPCRADTCELCDFLASQARRSATRRRRQSDLSRRQPLAPASQEGGQIVAVGAALLLAHGLSLLLVIPG